jgi:alpha-galactosidase
VSGLDPRKRYRVHEINLPQGTSSQLQAHDKIIDGSILAREGIQMPDQSEFSSAVIEFTAE